MKRVERASRAQSLSGKIFSSVLVFALALVLVFGLVMTSIYYYSYERDGEAKLSALAHEAAAYLNETPSAENVPALREQFAGLVRYTLIAEDGSVLFDSAADEGTMENHAQRPEVIEAETKGSSAAVRYSETLKTDTIYAAVRLDDGSVVRLSETRESLFAFLGSMLAPILVALVVATISVLLLSKTLTRRIMKPIDALNFADPLENEIYEEMAPLLARIDDQQKLLKQQNKELAQAENMRREFSSNVSHEMKTPLQVISGYAELMKNDMVQPGDRQKFAALIYEEAQAMRSLINDVLTLSRLDETSYDSETAVRIDLMEVSRRVAARLESFAAERAVEVRVERGLAGGATTATGMTTAPVAAASLAASSDFAAAPVAPAMGSSRDAEGASACIAGSETLMEEMLYNLIENGIRYNHAGGFVAVSVFVVKKDSRGSADGFCDIEYAPGCNEAIEQVVVRVRDTGPGIPAGMEEKIFERFFRLDKSRSKETGGTGLGLAIVKHAVLYHNGTIKVESEEGQGTTFTLAFPAKAAK